MSGTRGLRSDQAHIATGGRYSPSNLADIASEWGYSCEMSGATDVARAREDSPLAAGLIATQKLPSGLNVCASDLTTLHDNDRIGLARRSLTIAVNLHGSPITYAIDDDQTVSLVAESAMALSAADDTRMASSYRRGESSRILVIQACPVSVMDVELAEHLDAHLQETTATPLPLSCRARALSHELFSPGHTGLVGRLLAESCALELLACVITAQQAQNKSASWLHSRDIAKIHRVRDKLLSNLDAEHHLCDLARDVGMSTSTLKSKFAAIIGQPVFQFLRDKRLDRARDGLQQEGWTVSQAAYYVGYRHASNFATAFRRRYGVAPTSTRRPPREASFRAQAAE
jgi:AraC-like DNA-binding protein